MESPEKIVIRLAEWSPAAAGILSAAGNPENYRRQVEGGASLFEVMRGGERLGMYMLRVDRTADGAEGVLVAGAGRADFDLTAEIIPIAEKQLMEVGCVSMRIHTRRPGLVKKLAAAGWGGMEMVMRKDL